MSSLSAVASVLMRGVRAVRDGLGRLLSALVGDLQWQPPAWMQSIAGGLKRAGGAVHARPRRSALIALAALAAVALGWSGWRWYQALPKPKLVEFTVEAPARTCIECDPPGNQANPLIVRFAESVAPLEAVGKAIVASAAHVELSPRAAGDWTWVDDRTLRFQPEADWPVGQSYHAALAKKGLVAPQLKLAEYDFEFRAPVFAAKVEASEFYQDPVRAADKKIVTTLRFSHAVDPAELEQRFSLALYEKVADGQEREIEPAPGFRVTYDKHRVLAYLHSESLQVPAKEGRVVVKLRPGARAARGGNALDQELTASVTVPGLYSLGATGIEARIVRDEREEPSQALIIGTSHTVTEAEMTRAVEAWLLPVTHPDARLQADWARRLPGKPYYWSGPEMVSPAVLAAATRVELAYVPTEREHSDTHSFRLAADPGRRLYVRIGKGLKSFGGYVMPEAADAVVEVPAYPRDLRVLHQGSLLALSGKRKVTVFARGIRAYRITVGRLLPNQLQHLVTQTGDDLEQPRFDHYTFDENNITEKFTDIVRLPALKPGEPAYTAIDVGTYLARPGAGRQGIFLLRLEAWDPERDEVVRPATYGCEYGNCPDEGRTADQRLLLLTDLGLLAKRAVDGSQDLFVQSIATGLPLAGVTIEVLGRNGEPVLQQTTDGDGHARFPELRNLEGERQPVMYLARSGNDTSFLPLDWRGRRLDLSRFDVGGVSDPADRARLTAYLFSDRGIYRPGDEIRAAAIVRTQDWRPLPAGVPLRLEISDPRGIVVKRDTLQLTSGGFEEIRYRTRETAAAGTYTLQLFVVKERDRGELIGSIGVTVREFLPDRLRLRANFTAAAPGGWVSPDRLGAQVLLENLFGTPAAGRRVTATLRLQPAAPQFPQYEGFEFRDPQAAKEGFTESLPEQVTSATGEATFDLNLQRFARATYRASLVIEGFEADGGRGVIAETAQLVSSLPFLIGWKADGDLAYVPRGTARQVELIAIDPKAARIAAGALKLRHIERRYLSMLLRQDNGTFRYESRLKEVQLAEHSLDVAAGGSRAALPTDTPGSYSELVVDADGQVLARIDYTVAGAANLTRSLEKNAELQVVLDRKDYQPGDEVELQVLAPYTGAGLITIERDRVYAWRWFKTATTSSVQRIRLPAGLEGNAYVSVTFIRDPGSEEIHTAPLSYGVQPFSIAIDARRANLTLTAPALVKPGGTVEVGYRSTAPGRIVVFAVDEGILQVARYRTPDPLGHFFAKRALRVDTQQILDRILPEFRNSMLSAPGGDEGGLIGARLNPFKRKTDAPVAWWSGIVEADAGERKLQVPVPESFNGTLRLMAVSVADASIGTAERKLLVRADLVLSPNAPLTVTPGDEFEVSVGVANNLAGSGPEAAVQVALAPSAGLEVLGASRATVRIGELREGSTRFKVRARDLPGPASLRFTANLRDSASAATAALSLRPATPYMSSILAGQFRGQAEVPVKRELYPLYRTLQAGVSPLPLGLAHGLVTYLDRYSYTCTEQVVSQSMPAIVLAARPEFGRIKGHEGATLESVIDELRARQDGEGAFRYWPGGVQVVDFVSVYAYHTLLEAAERGQAVPGDLLENGITYLRRVAARDANSLEDERTTAYAIYLLARQGVMVSNEASALQKRLEERHAKEWRSDIAAAWLAATFKLLRQDAQAVRTLDGVKFGREVAYDRWHDPMTSDAMLLYLVARHFPERLARLPDSVLTSLVQRLNGGGYHSLSAATTILALDAYATAAGQRANAALAVVAVLRDKSLRPLQLPAGLFPRADFPADTRALRFTAGADLPGFYLVDQSGFDRKPPTEALAQGLEVQRDYLDADGKPLQQVKVGQEVVVRVRFRAIGRPAIDDAVFVDLLPGGFDLVVPPGPVQTQAYLSASTGDEGESGDGEEQAEACTCGFLVLRPQGFPDFADLREDRVVLYGRATDSLQEYRYRIKATNAGTFAVPPAYGESMYEPGVRARTVAARIVVTAP